VELLSGWIGKLIGLGPNTKDPAVLDLYHYLMATVLDLYHYLMATKLTNESKTMTRCKLMTEPSSERQRRARAYDSLDGIEERAAEASLGQSEDEDEYDQIRRWEIQTLYWIITSGLNEVRFKLGVVILDQLDESPCCGVCGRE